MSNVCDFVLFARGGREQLKTLIKHLDACCGRAERNDPVIYYEYGDGTREPLKKRFGKVILDEQIESDTDSSWDRMIEADGDSYLATIEGYCGWSVHFSMMGSSFGKDSPPGYILTLQEISAELNIDVEVYSEEPGMGFEEHIIIREGEVTSDESLTMRLVNLEDFSTVQEAEKKLLSPVAVSEFENGWMKFGGFGPRVCWI